MALEATFRELQVKMHKLHDALDALQVAFGDKPVHDEAALADSLENKVLDMMGVLQEARKAALNARAAVGSPVDLERAWRALRNCQDRFHDIEKQFSADLAAYDKLRELDRLGSNRGGEWLSWAGSAKQNIEECRPPLEEVSRALAYCWQEIAEHAGATSISVRTSNVSVGQRIVPGAMEPADLGHERIT
ncbi:MAG TPA: hypothetical protein VF753_01155 [Terriglobales bacterium]